MPDSTPALVPPLSPPLIRTLRFSAAFPPTTASALAPSLRRIASALLAVQAQDPDAALLSFWLRLPSPRPPRAVLAPLLLSGSSPAGLSRVWANRITLQVVTTRDRASLSPAVLSQLRKGTLSSVRRLRLAAAAERVLGSVDASMGAWLAQGRRVTSQDVDARVEEELDRERREARAEEGSCFSAEAVGDARRVLRYSLFVLATADGRAERVMTPGDGRRIVVQKSEGVRERMVGMEEGTRECVKRYFEGYGPATEADVRYWLGVPAAQSKQAVEGLVEDGELRRVQTEMGEMLVRKGCCVERREGGVRLVGRFEPVLLAHKDKTWMVDEGVRRKVWSRNADVAACVLVGGRVKGVWKKEAGGIRVRLFEGGVGEWVGEVFGKAREILEGFYGVEGTVEVRVEREGEAVLVEEGGAGEVASRKRWRRR